MADLSTYARLPPAMLSREDFYCQECREELWACVCTDLPSFEEASRGHHTRDLIKERNHNGDR